MRVGDWDGIADLDPSEVEQRLVANVDLLLAARPTGATEVATVSSWPEPLRTLWYLNWLQYEIDLGGMTGFLYNRNEQLAATAAALVRTGAVGSARVIDEARALLDEEPDAWHGDAAAALEERFEEQSDLDDREACLTRYLVATLTETLSWATSDER